jgi:starch phosphorylase
MDSDTTTANATTQSAADRNAPDMSKFLQQYGCGPIQFTGTGDALYERHLMFDNVADLLALGPRERYEAVARSGRRRHTSGRTPSAFIISPWSS